ncbi:calmodulin-domain protein kinase, partial [Reticulomyxa filosa]
AFFESLDENHDGVITFEEFKKGMKERDKKFTESQLETMFQNIDIDDSMGNFFFLFPLKKKIVLRITLNELLTAAASQHLLAQDERLFQAFLDLDKDSSGTLTKEELKDAMVRLNPTLKDSAHQRQISVAFASADRNQDGVIDYEEFLRVLHPQFKEDQQLKEFVGDDELYYAGTNFDVLGANPQEMNRDISLLVPRSVKEDFVKSIEQSKHLGVDLTVTKDIEFLFNGKQVKLTSDELLLLLEKIRK